MHVFQAESMSVEWPGAQFLEGLNSLKSLNQKSLHRDYLKCLHHDQTANMLSFVKCAWSIDHKIPKYEMLKKTKI